VGGEQAALAAELRGMGSKSRVIGNKITFMKFQK